MAEKTVSIYDRLFEAAEAGNYNLSLITKALECATQAHRGQYRRSGEPYVMHPLNVALILIELGMDSQSVAAALLHDVVEDTALTTNDIKKQFGKEIALLVEGVTKLGKVPNYSREEQQAENIRKMLFAMAEDVRVIIIKLADRLHNMRTIEFHKEQKRRDIALETIEVYAPIAHRLGIRTIKEELEDLAMYQLDPVAYDDIERELATRAQGREELLAVLQHKIKTRLKNILPNLHIEGRIKSIYGIYRKMYIQQKTIDEIYDVYAMRIIVDTVNDCYNVLGVIHDMFRPIPGRFKDYISTPKQNRYQSLHTTVFDQDGVAFEVQIRTWEMHETAEYGIAAHWKYKANLKKTDQKMEDSLSWIRQLLDSQKEVEDVGEIVRNIKTDLTFDETFAVTPRGDIINLPAGSTVIDFAYAIHSAIGNRMTGAKVNGRIVPIDYKIKTGEVVEIITGGQGKGPARDWLNIVKTSEARTKIRTWFKKERRDENIAEGKVVVEKAMKRDLLTIPTEEKRNEFFEMLAKTYHCADVDDFFAMIGYGGLQMSRLMNKVRDEYNKNYRNVEKEAPTPETLIKEDTTSKGAVDGVIIEGVDNCLIKFSKCCGPLPGDDIVGFITRGHGVSIHKRDCPNVPEIISESEEPERWVNARWTNQKGVDYKVTLNITTIDTPTALADVTVTLANMRIGVHAVNARKLKDGNYQILVTVSAEGTSHLKTIISKLDKVSGVISVDRTGA